MSREMPTKLNAELIIEAIIEIRLQASSSLSDVLPGAFLAKHGRSAVSIDKLSPSALPKQIRDSDPSLRHQPLVKITLGDYQLMVGDQLLTLVCPVQPYPSGAAIKQKAVKLFNEVLELGIVEEIERFSMKYTNFVSVKTLTDAMDLLTLKASLADKPVDTFGGINFQFALEEDARVINLIRVAAIADVRNKKTQDVERGLVIEVDSIDRYETSDIEAFRENFPTLLDSLHDTHKKAFFSLLTNEALKTLGAEYEY